MNMTKQELALVNFVRGLYFDDLLDANDGIEVAQEKAMNKANELTVKGEMRCVQDFKDRAAILEKLAKLLGDANADYRAHIKPEEAQTPTGNGVTQMLKSHAGEAVHLFKIMQKYGATCSLEFQAKNSLDPLIGIARAKVGVDYFEGSEGDAVIVELDEASFSFELGNHSFLKYVSDCQIEVWAISNDDGYAATFNSGVIPPEGIKEANNYDELYKEDYYAIDMRGDALAENLEKIAGQIRAGWSVCDVSNSFENDGHLYIDLNRSKGDESEA